MRNIKLGSKVFIIVIIFLVIFISIFYNFFQNEQVTSIESLEDNLCKYHNISLISEDFSEEIIILSVETKTTALSIYPELDNLMCLGKIVDFEITFYEQVEKSVFIEVTLYKFTDEKLVNIIKIILLISILLLNKIKLFYEYISKNLILLSIVLVIYYINLIFTVKFNIFNFIIESIFYLLIFIVLSTDSKKILIINKNHNLSIDSLRAVAVLAVIFNHLGTNIFYSGYLGVDLFFVISGYVITNKYITLDPKNLKTFYYDFLFFRVKRILPVLLFFVSVTSIFVYLVDYNFKETLKVAIFSTFALSNAYLYTNSLDYFSEDSSLNSFTHTWSLGIEEQFYLIFPFLIYALVKNKISSYFIALLTTLSLIFFLFNQASNPDGTYYLLQYRFWQMALGCLIVIYREELKFIGKKLPLNFLLLISLISFTINTPYSSLLTTLSTFSFFMLLISIDNREKTNKFLISKKLATIGTLSYSIYLWHWPIIALSRMKNYEFINVEFQIMLMVIFAIISYKLIEQPFRNVSITQRKNYFKIIIFITLLVVLMIWLVINFSDRNNSLTGSNPFLFTEADYENIVNAIDCYHPSDIENAFDNCIRHNSEKRNVYLIGDSHSTNHYLSLEKKFLKEELYSFYHLVDWGFIRGIQGVKGCAAGQKCIDSSFEKHLSFYDANLTENDLIIFSFSRDWFKIDGEIPRQNIELKLKMFETNFNRLVSTINLSGANMILIGDIPKTCGSKVNYFNDIIVNGNVEICTIEENLSLKDRETLTNIYNKVKGGNIQYLDPHDYFCYESRCSIIDLQSGQLLFSDLSPHISNNGLKIIDLFWEDNFEKLKFSQ
jgi:peptidoglycan/LPS O-acetylase OafA/YrhL